MQPFAVVFEARLRQFFFEKVFDGLDIVIGGFFDFFNALGGDVIKIFGDRTQKAGFVGRELAHFGDFGGFREHQQPLDFDVDAVFD